jgi:hypothetical protein
MKFGLYMHYWKTILKGWLDDNATGDITNNLDSNLFFQVQLDHLVKVSRVDQENGEHQVCMASRAEEGILVHQAHRDIVNSVTLPQDILVGQRQNTFNLDVQTYWKITAFKFVSK